MPKILPSEVVLVIDALFTHAAASSDMYRGTIKFSPQHSTMLATIVDLIDRIPQELIILKPNEFARLVCCISAIRSALRRWETGSAVNSLKLEEPLEDIDVVTALRRLIHSCPDVYPTPETNALGFIEDLEYRAALRIDLSDAERAMSNGEWKAATVLCGSVLEALLLWEIRVRPKDMALCVDSLKKDVGPKPSESEKPEKWSLYVLAKVAHQMELITDETRKLILLAKDFRNLIHPGRTERMAMTCDRGTALAALAATEFVVRDLTAGRVRNITASAKRLGKQS